MALRILEAEVASTESTPREWDVLVSQLSDECERGANKTFIAMLGTALLARATNVGADPFALKSGPGTPGAYSARSLCQHVLAAHAPRLKIDLGVTGREPLNNQPFFAEERVHDAMPVHSKAKAAFGILMEGLKRISRIETENEARGALRAFLQERVERRYKGNLVFLEESRFSASDVIAAIVTFVSTNSESGRRAQAAAAGLLESMTPNLVEVSRVNDPDRHFPGDVNISEDGALIQAFEIRDKAVNAPDVYHFIGKVAQTGIRRAGIVAVSPTQSQLDESDLIRFAAERGIAVQFFYSWHGLANAASFWFGEQAKWRNAMTAIHKRALELEVSEDGIRQWESLTREK